VQSLKKRPLLPENILASFDSRSKHKWQWPHTPTTQTLFVCKRVVWRFKFRHCLGAIWGLFAYCQHTNCEISHKNNRFRFSICVQRKL